MLTSVKNIYNKLFHFILGKRKDHKSLRFYSHFATIVFLIWFFVLLINPFLYLFKFNTLLITYDSLLHAFVISPIFIILILLMCKLGIFLHSKSKFLGP